MRQIEYIIEYSNFIVTVSKLNDKLFSLGRIVYVHDFKENYLSYFPETQRLYGKGISSYATLVSVYQFKQVVKETFGAE